MQSPIASKLAQALQKLCSEANSRGNLYPGGSDANTGLGQAYLEAQLALEAYEYSPGAEIADSSNTLSEKASNLLIGAISAASVPNTNPRQEAPEAADADPGAAGLATSFYALSGRNHGDDDDTVLLCWVADGESPGEVFKVRLQEVTGIEPTADYPVYYCTEQLIGNYSRHLGFQLQAVHGGGMKDRTPDPAADGEDADALGLQSPSPSL